MKTCGTRIVLERHEHFETVLLCSAFFFLVFYNLYIDDTGSWLYQYKNDYISWNHNLYFRSSISDECSSLLLILLRLDIAFDELCEIDFAFLLAAINQCYSLDIMILLRIG